MIMSPSTPEKIFRAALTGGLTVRQRTLCFLAVGVLTAVLSHWPGPCLSAPDPLAVRLSNASRGELLSLPGVGPARARLLVEWAGAGGENRTRPAWLVPLEPFLSLPSAGRSGEERDGF